MTADVRAVARYELALLVRGRRWVPPLLLLAFVLVTATAGGPPAGDALAFGGAALVPVCAWLTRVVVTGDPAAARACLMAAVGPARTQVGCLVAAVAASGALCLVTTGALTALVLAGRPGDADHPAVVAVTALSGLVSGSACALVGVALGAVCNPPVLRRADAAVVAAGLGVILCLASSSSPAYAAISDLSRTPRSAAAPVAWPSLGVAAAVLAVAAALSVWTAARRGVR